MFGEVADLYDRYRPAYPVPLVDDLVAHARLDGSQSVLEVGAGTGKATLMFAARGIPVVAVEPSREMASLAHRNCRAFIGVEIEQADFEQWDPRARRFPLLFSAQAWHWVDPALRYSKAREVLVEDGLLAAFWNRPAWDRCELRTALLGVYEETVPELAPDGPMHPANLRPDGMEDWEGEIAAVDGLGCAEVRYYEWEQAYSVDDFVGLLATISDVRLLAAARRRSLFAAVGAVIDAAGGSITLAMRTRLCVARRA